MESLKWTLTLSSQNLTSGTYQKRLRIYADFETFEESAQN
jgi:hypothetical protein